MADTRKRERVEQILRTIIVKTKGCDESEVVESARLSDDLGLESIDFMEISTSMEEVLGVELTDTAIEAAIDSEVARTFGWLCEWTVRRVNA